MAKVVQDKCLGHCCKHQRDSYHRITESLQLKCRKKSKKGWKQTAMPRGNAMGRAQLGLLGQALDGLQLETIQVVLALAKQHLQLCAHPAAGLAELCSSCSTDQP